jgi:tetratricopeptide (TPR) repeat protein
LCSLASSYKFSGEPSRAISFVQRSLAIDESAGNETNLQVGLFNVSDTFEDVGALRQAIGSIRRSLILSRKLESVFNEGIALEILGSLLSKVGDQIPAAVALNRSVRLFEKLRQLQWEGVVAVRLTECAIWIGDIVNASSWAELAWDRAANRGYERDFTRAALRQGQVALCQRNNARADERLHHALTRARASNLVEAELPALIAIAELELQRGRRAEARARLDDVWEAAERGRYPLQLADAYNVLAAIAIAEGDHPAAINAAIDAYKAAWCDGPPYAYHWGLQKAKAHLLALGAPEPAMPPFDESKFPPLPEVEINPRDEYWVDPQELARKN